MLSSLHQKAQPADWLCIHHVGEQAVCRKELHIRNASLSIVPCLNDSDAQVHLLKTIISRQKRAS